MTRLLCQWATCRQPAVTVEDGWAHCGQHLREHRAFQREEAEAELKAQRRQVRGQDVTLRGAILRLHKAGHTDAEIAAQLLITPGSAKGERQKLGLAANVMWNGPTVAQPCGTHAAFNRHKQKGEPIDDACRIGERVYQRERGRTRRARAAA